MFGTNIRLREERERTHQEASDLPEWLIGFVGFHNLNLLLFQTTLLVVRCIVFSSLCPTR